VQQAGEEIVGVGPGFVEESGGEIGGHGAGDDRHGGVCPLDLEGAEAQEPRGGCPARHIRSPVGS
jgi:hypothetical protein